jgi:polyisoprenoid-binding protein YceI
MRIRLAIALFVLLAGLPAASEEIRIELDPDTTAISFELKATMHTVHGTAKLASGIFAFDTSTGVATGQAVVEAASADTDNDKRDKKMHDEVLLSAEHPRIVLRADRFEGRLAEAGTSEITFVGSLEVLGRPHPIRIPMSVTVDGDAATVSATFAVPYVEWGLDDPSTFVLRVAKEVPVTIRSDRVSLTREPEVAVDDRAE